MDFAQFCTPRTGHQIGSRRKRLRLVLWVSWSVCSWPLLSISPTWAAQGDRAVTNRTPAKKTFRIVLDPGHGGTDQGTVFQKDGIRLAEKDVTLALAQEAARQLRNKGFEVELTRITDHEIPLNARTAVANRIKADLFISIHMNSHSGGESLEAQGIESFILNNATDATSKRLAHFENAGMSTQAAGANGAPPSEVGLILKDLTLDGNLSESKRLACALQYHLVSVTQPLPELHLKGSLASAGLGRYKPLPQRNRGVKQALFYVLLGADMPSVLVEAGFLTHPTDRAMVTSPHGQRAIGAAIVRAIEQFKRDQNTPSALAELSRCKVH